MTNLELHTWNLNMYRYAISCVMLMTFFFLSEIHAQKRTLGATFSYAGCGIAYERQVNDETFYEVQLRAETAHMFSSLASNPGITGSFTWNMIFAESVSRNGNSISFFAGPGVIAGITDGIPLRKGLLFGLKGRIGGECVFSRNVALSASLSPVLGAHVTMIDGMPCMGLYINGLMCSLMPEVGIKYSF